MYKPKSTKNKRKSKRKSKTKSKRKSKKTQSSKNKRKSKTRTKKTQSSKSKRKSKKTQSSKNKRKGKKYTLSQIRTLRGYYVKPLKSKLTSSKKWEKWSESLNERQKENLFKLLNEVKKELEDVGIKFYIYPTPWDNKLKKFHWDYPLDKIQDLYYPSDKYLQEDYMAPHIFITPNDLIMLPGESQEEGKLPVSHNLINKRKEAHTILKKYFGDKLKWDGSYKQMIQIKL